MKPKYSCRLDWMCTQIKWGNIMALAPSSTAKAKLAAAALTAATVIGGAFPSAAQQMAAAPSTPDFSTCDRMSEANPKGAIACRVEVLNRQTAALRQESAALRQRTQVAENNIDCAREVGELRAAIPAATEIARELVRVSGRPAAEYGICRLRDGIRAGLAAR